MAQVSYGTITITDTNDIERIYVVYAKSTTNTTAPSATVGTWTESISTAPGSGNYIWQRTVTERSGTHDLSYGDPVCVTGPQGGTGATGATGRGVSSIVTTYCNYGTGTPAASYDGWQPTVPTYDSTKPNYWVKTVITYTSGDPATDTSIYKDNGLTEAIAQSVEANYNAAMANSISQSANENAQGALSIANGVRQHFFWIDTDYSAGVPAGAYVAEQGEDSFKANPTTGNLITRADGIYIRKGTNLLTSLTNTALTFYNPTTNTKAIELGSVSSTPSLLFYNPSNASISMMDLSSTGLTFKNATGTELGKFGTDGLSMSGTLNIRGGGRIGQDSSNYWDFGDNRSYKDTDSAYLMGVGNASIQLGESGHWRLDKNRIHAGWYQLSDTTRGILHFDTADENGSTYYWDYGLNYPNRSGSGNNKFLYVRRSNSTTTTTLATMKGRVDDDTYWTYKFWVDGEGKVHAPGFYIGNSNTPIGGGAGTVAEKLVSGAGSSTQPVYFRTDSGHEGELSAVSWDVDSSINASSTTNDSNVATIGAIKSYVTGRGYVTSSGVTSVTIAATSPVVSSTATAQTGSSASTTISLANGYGDTKNPYGTKTKNYVLAGPTTGSAAAPTFRALVAADIPDLSGIYLTSYTETDPVFTASAAHGITSSDITNWNGKTSNTGTVTKVSTGAGLTGGDVTTTGTIKANLTSETKLSNAALSVTEDANRIYPVRIDKNSKMVVVVPWTNVNGNYLTGITSSDVTTALGFTPYDSANPNGYTSNAGTVTSVKVQGSNGLTGSGTVTSSGTITISHSDTSTQASSSNSGRTYIQSVTLDGYGHVTGLSTATETVTNTHNTAYLYVGASNGTTNAATTNGNTYLILMDGGSATTRRKISGSGTVSVTSNDSGDIAITGTAHPTELPNPKTLSLVVYNSTSTTASSSTTTYKGNESSNTSVNVAGNNAVTNISSNTAGQLILTRADGTQSDPITVKITATTSDTAATADKLNISSDVGSTSIPVYFKSSTGLPDVVTSIAYSLLPVGTGASEVAQGNHTHGNITNGGDITATAPTIANGDQIIINDHSASKITNGPTFDGSTTTQFLSKKGTWETPGGTYSLPLAANGTRGGVQIGYTQSGKNYPVQLSSEKMYVNVPWENTTYGLTNALSSHKFTWTFTPSSGSATTTVAEFVAGTGISLTDDTTNKKITIGNSGVTGIKGNSEGSYRIGQVNLTAANIGAFEKKAYDRGTIEAGIRPYVDQSRANRLAFLPAEQIIIEKTTDGGTTWVDAGYTDSQKLGLFTENGGSVQIPLLNNAKSTLCGVRITISGMKYNVPSGTAETAKYNYWNSSYINSTERYFNVREWWFWLSANNDTIRPEIYCATGANPTNWVTVFNTDFGMTGWSGSDWVRAGDGKTFGGGTTQTGNYWNWRLVFWSKMADGKTSFQSTTVQTIQQIRCYGDSVWSQPNNLMAKDHLYSWDNSMNATFPAKVTASGGFSGNLTGNVTGNVSGSAGSVAWTGVTGKPTVTGSSATGITASTTANKVTVGSHSTDYGITAVGSGSASFSATVSSHVLSFSHSHSHVAPTLGSKVPTVSTSSATVSITDNGHTHSI